MRDWNSQARNREARLARADHLARGKQVQAGDAGALLEAVLEPGDRVCLEGNNQKQADFLASRAGCRGSRPGARPAHGAVGAGAARTSRRVRARHRRAARLLLLRPAGGTAGAGWSATGQIDGRRHPHLSRAVRPLLRRPDAAASAWSRRRPPTAAGNLYTGPNTEDTPAIVEATAFKRGIVIAQVNELVDTVPRVDIPGDWVDFVIQSPRPHYIEPLFTRDPAQISEIQVLMAMMAIKGIYAEYDVNRLNHGIGFDTAAIELLLPTYAESPRPERQDLPALGAQPAPGADPGDRGRLRRERAFLRLRAGHGGLHPRPARRLLHRPGRQHAVQPRVLPGGRPLRLRPVHRLDPADRPAGNSSTATLGRIAGFGGAPNMGADARGRRHASPAWLKAGREARAGRDVMPRGRKLVVQMVETFREHMQPAFVERLDAWELAESAGMALPPVMIYGDDVTHILTEEGIANLLLCRTDEEREQAIRGVAGYTPVGLGRDKRDGREPARPRRRSAAPRISASTSAWRRATCSRRDRSRTSCARRAASTTRPSASATGEHGDTMETLTFEYRGGQRARAARQASAGRRRRLRQPGGAGRAGRPRRRLPRSRSRPRRSASARSGRRCWTTSSPAIRWPTCASPSTMSAPRRPSSACGWTRRWKPSPEAQR